MSRQHTSISNAALDLSNLAREANALEAATKYTRDTSKLENMIADREEDIVAEFSTLAKLLGFTVSKIEDEAPTDHVARFFRRPTDAIQAAE